jgi:glycerophosphoryl diester phosphodiesterase
MTVSRFLRAPAPIGVAHRGVAEGGAENSLEAFQRAIDLGYRYLETDARVCADGVCIAFHDARLDRVTDRQGRLIAQPWSQVRTALIAGRETIPRLADVLGTWPDAFVNIDVKCHAAIGPAVAAIRATGAQDRVCVAAFSDRRLDRLRGLLGPQVCTAIGPAEAVSLRLGRLRRPRGQAAQLPHRLGRYRVVDRSLVTRAHRLGLAVHVWTVNDAADMRALLDLGVDGVMTDAAATLRTVLRERGAWAS